MPMPKHIEIANLLLTLDLAGTAVFAISGAAVGVKHRLDVFGVCVLAFVAENAGGMVRDVLIGAVPPVAFVGWLYVTVSLLAGVATFVWHPRLERLHTPILIFDAAGLGLFSVSGTQKALAFVAALGGAGVVVAGSLLHLPPAAATIGGAALCFAVRLVAIRRGWGLPTPDRPFHF
jgi:uncharacterized membrane protein YeiH